jgi:hypothetical protein
MWCESLDLPLLMWRWALFSNYVASSTCIVHKSISCQSCTIKLEMQYEYAKCDNWFTALLPSDCSSSPNGSVPYASPGLKGIVQRKLTGVETRLK